MRLDTVTAENAQQQDELVARVGNAETVHYFARYVTREQYTEELAKKVVEIHQLTATVDALQRALSESRQIAEAAPPAVDVPVPVVAVTPPIAGGD